MVNDHFQKSPSEFKNIVQQYEYSLWIMLLFLANDAYDVGLLSAV